MYKILFYLKDTYCQQILKYGSRANLKAINSD